MLNEKIPSAKRGRVLPQRGKTYLLELGSFTGEHYQS
jgi:hypothetical protein